jgi:hypothetical protein
MGIKDGITGFMPALFRIVQPVRLDSVVLSGTATLFKEWGNLKHELDVIGSDIVDCDEQAQQVYYLLATRMDLIDAEKTVTAAIFHREHPSPIADVEMAYEQTDPTLVRSSLTVLSSHASSLYLAHYANVKPADYANIKQRIKDLYARAGGGGGGGTAYDSVVTAVGSIVHYFPCNDTLGSTSSPMASVR